MAKNDGTIRCSFCGKRQEQVKRILSGPDVNICDECVAICADIIDESMPDDDYVDSESSAEGINLLKPAEIKAFLDE